MPQVLPFTDVKIKNLQPKEKAYKVFDGRGLYLEIYPHGSKIWRFKYRFEGKDTRMSFGAYPEVSLKAARDRLATARLMLWEGKSPSAPVNKGDTFRDVTEDWAGRFLVLSQTAAATIKKKRLFLDKHILPYIGEMPVREIDPPTILNKLMRPVEARGQLETAHRIKMLCSQIFRFAVATGKADRAIRPKI